MRFFPTYFPVVLALAVCSGMGSLALAQDPKKSDGWVPLFNGADLSGFERVNGTANYYVKGGAIVGVTSEGSKNSFLKTIREYGDFELEFEVKLDPALNSGIQIRSRQKYPSDVAIGKKSEVGRYFGPQIEIEKSPGQSGNVYGEAIGKGWISTAPRDKTYAHELINNEGWNRFRIVAKGATITTFINGKQVEKLTDEALYKSHSRGSIGFQVHKVKKGTGPFTVRWKNIRIKELK